MEKIALSFDGVEKCFAVQAGRELRVMVKPDDVSVLRPQPAPTLTLVTCYPFYYAGDAPKRYILHASLADVHRDLERGSSSANRKN